MFAASSSSRAQSFAEELRTLLLARINAGALDVPPFPTVAMKLRELVSSGDYALSDLALVVKKDQALASSVLRVANSPHYRRGAEITTVERAIGLLGADEACRIALAATIGHVTLQKGPLSELRQIIWRQALAAAIIADCLAYVRRLNSDHGFMAGLLHDIGRLVAVAGLETILREEGDAGNLPASEWMAIVDAFHLPIGAAVAKRWNLSALLREAITYHHDPSAATDHRDVVEVLVTCDDIVALLDDCPYLLPHDLTRLPSVRGAREADALMESLPLIPSFINSLGGANPSWQHMPSRIDKPDTLLSSESKPVQIPAIWVRSIGESACVVHRVAPEGFSVTSGEPMAEGGVARVRLLEPGQPPLEVSGRVLLTNARDKSSQSEIRLFAIPGVGWTLWKQLYARC